MTENLFLCHDVFDVRGEDREAVRAEAAGAVRCHEDVVLETDASEVIVSLQLLIVHEALVCAFPLPLLNQSRNEIKTRLGGHHMTRLEAAGHSEVAQTEERVTLWSSA